ncbi:ribonuclease [uncultured Mediterranean phage uvMED]|nr:ribonuclease [uncultured Mediterranean phage uvMED]BAR37103.1 ribonuclease [uncultured Mediterranean phage uvMED]
MPKIPTFTARATPTTEVASIKTGLKLSPTATPAASLLPAAKAIDKYYIKQRDNNEKLEAKKKFYEMKIESDKIIKQEENNPDEFSSVNTYNQQFGQYSKQELSQIKNKRVKQKLQLLLDSDQAESVYKVKSNSFKAFESQNLSIYNTEQNTLATEYSLADNSEIKKIKKQSRIDSATEFANMHNMGKSWLDKEVQTINTDSAIFDADVAIANKKYNEAKEILLSAKNVDAEEIQKRIITIEKEGVEYRATSYGVGQILEGKNPLIGPPIKNTTDKKILEGTDNYLFSVAEKNELNEEQTFAFVDDKFSKTGLLSPSYQELIDSGFTAGSSTTFDNLADIPPVLISAIKTAEIADKMGRLNVYTTDEQETFFKNVIVSKQILGMNDFQAIKNARDFQLNYDRAVIKGATKQRNRTFTLIETKFKETKATNIGEVKGYANKLFNMYVASNIDPVKAQNLVVDDLEKNLQIVDDYAYMKRDIDAFKSIGGLDMVKPVKEYIIENKMVDEDSKQFFLRYNGGGIFEIRRKLDLAPVFDKDNQPMIFYNQDLYLINQERETAARDIIKKETIELQERKIKAKEEFETSGFDITGT